MDIKQISDKVDYIAQSWESFNVGKEETKQKLEYLEKKMKDMRMADTNQVFDYQKDEIRLELTDYIRKGDSSGLETKSLSAASDESGGYLVTPHLQQRIVSNIQTKSPMRRLASVENISSNSLEIVIEKDDFAAGWVGEETTRDVTDSAKLTKKKIMVHEMYAQPKATQRLLDDAEINVENWLLERLEDSFLRVENKSFIQGKGQNEPFGILHYSNQIQVVKANDSSKIQIEDLMSLINSIEEKYLANATFLMNRRVLAEVQKIKDGNGRFIMQPAISEKMPETILGIPVVCSDDMPSMEEKQFVIALGDFKAAYKIVERPGVAVMRDPYTEKPFVKFYAVKRVGADVVNMNAIKLLQL